MSPTSPVFQSDYTVTTDVFQGPLDLLLSLIEKRKLFVNDISLSRVTEDYIGYIREQGSFPVDQGAHFILIASTLMLIKSRSLLPDIPLTEEEEEDIRSLEKRLEVYGSVKRIAEVLEDLFGSAIEFQRAPMRGMTPVFSPDESMSCEDLCASLKDIVERNRTAQEKEDIPQTQVKKTIDLRQVIESLTERIKKGVNVQFSELVRSSVGDGDMKEKRVSAVVHFIALLELMKQGLITADQSDGDIHITHKKI